jgi:hypothetical protein
MSLRGILLRSAALLCGCVSAATYADGSAAPAAGNISPSQLARVKPGISTKNQIQALLGAPWRILQFNDCGMAMPGQADETWDYRGSDSSGTYRLHVEFDDRGRATLVAKIPDKVLNGAGTPALTAPTVMAHNMKM